VSVLTEDQIIGICLSSILIGGNSWTSLHKMLAKIPEDQQEISLKLLLNHVAKRFEINIAKWICDNFKYTEAQTITLIAFLDNKHDP
jgi:hypothetical protein